MRLTRFLPFGSDTVPSFRDVLRADRILVEASPVTAAWEPVRDQLRHIAQSGLGQNKGDDADERQR